MFLFWLYIYIYNRRNLLKIGNPLNLTDIPKKSQFQTIKNTVLKPEGLTQDTFLYIDMGHYNIYI